MSENFVKAIRAAEIAPGGMKAVELSGRELVVCNCDGSFHAIDRRCGHMNAPLEMGTLDGSILTCAMHCARFEVTQERPSLVLCLPILGTSRFRQEQEPFSITSAC